MDLLETTGLWHSASEQDLLPVRPATLEELGLVHTADYIAAVQSLSVPDAEELFIAAQDGDERISVTQQAAIKAQLALKYGFADGDTPALPGMHEVSARIAGGTLLALSTVMAYLKVEHALRKMERPLHVFHPAGGLHHAWAERASGFCVYNDTAVAIAHVLRASEAKVTVH